VYALTESSPNTPSYLYYSVLQTVLEKQNLHKPEMSQLERTRREEEGKNSSTNIWNRASGFANKISGMNYNTCLKECKCAGVFNF
jgi:hypothetical protein